MIACPSCGESVAEAALSCPACGAAFVDSWTPTRHQISPRLHPQINRGSSEPSPSSSARLSGDFTTGAVLADRYRIVSLIGRGGMGQVYKAEDLKLDQTVALKFLPESIALDSAALTRFRNEVRVTRQISHPNVCRVYDIGEIDGRTFLSMEFIDGEDLSLLLRRIGRLPGDKAVEIARQICAGVAAAHDQGVLHRDLKPANVMIDGRGKARVTDFGVAVVEQELSGKELIAGTPTYMAPEQLKGKAVTQQSDIYALGLVLYELFTGKRVFEGNSLPDLIKLHDESTPATPSTHVKGIDPLVEKVILRCLEKDPKKRPASAIQIAAALPGGDPLQAALALGETPSPEMVAAAGEKTGLRPATAVIMLSVFVLGLLTFALLSNWGDTRVQLFHDNSPDELAHTARDLINRLGYTNRPTDSVYGFQDDIDLQQYVARSNQSKVTWSQLVQGRPAPVYFWYRESPQNLEPAGLGKPGMVTEDDPPPIISGMISAKFDPRARLVSFATVPPQVNQHQEGFSPADWTPLFAAAGLELSRFIATEPTWTSLGASDLRVAWTGTYADLPDIPLRVEAAAYHGKPVYFEVVMPWTRPARSQTFQMATPQKIATAIFLGVLFIPAIAAILLARYNIRCGRGDRRGAFRLASFIFVITILAWLLAAHHTPTPNELRSFIFNGLGPSLLFGGLIWLLYMALEPFVRRRWPQVMISWSRVLTGSLRDPLVGRDVLIGLAVGVAVAVVFPLERAIDIHQQTMTRPSSPASDGHHLVSNLLEGILMTIGAALLYLFVFFILRVLVRKQWIAACLYVLILVLTNVLSAPDRLVMVVSFGLWSSVAVFVLLRFGLVTFATYFFVTNILFVVPITTDLSAWYAGSAIAVVVLMLVVAGFAFHTSLGGQKVFEAKLLEA